MIHKLASNGGEQFEALVVDVSIVMVRLILPLSLNLGGGIAYFLLIPLIAAVRLIGLHGFQDGSLGSHCCYCFVWNGMETLQNHLAELQLQQVSDKNQLNAF